MVPDRGRRDDLHCALAESVPLRDSEWRPDGGGILRHEPYSWAYSSLGKLLTRTGELDEAGEVLAEGSATAPDARVFSALGDLRIRQHRLAEAEAALRRAIALDPSFPDPHYPLGRVLSSLGRTDEARAEFAAFEKSRAASRPRGLKEDAIR